MRTNFAVRFRRALALGGVLSVLSVGLVLIWRQRGLESSTAHSPKRASLEKAPLRRVLAYDIDADMAVLGGRVVDQSGARVAHAQISVTLAGIDESDVARPIAIAVTRADGAFLVEDLLASDYVVTATVSGFLPARQDVRLSPGQKRTDLVLKVQPGGVRVSGHVYDAGGGTIPRAQIRAVPGPEPGGGIFATETIESGEYEISLPAGQFYITADASGYAAVRQAVRVAQPSQLDFRLNPAAGIRGVVKDKQDGTTVGGASVLLKDEARWWLPPRSLLTNGQGEFEFVDVDAGEYVVVARKGVLVGRAAARMAVDMATVAPVTVFVGRGASIAGTVRVKRTDGLTPLGNAAIRTSEVGAFKGEARTATRVDGGYQVEGIPPGRYLLTAEAPGCAALRREIFIPTAEPLRGIDFELRPESKVSGTVVDAEDKPVTAAAVSASVFGLGCVTTLSGRQKTVRTDVAGAFEIGSLCAGEVRVEADAPDVGRAVAPPARLEEGGEVHVKLTLRAGASVLGQVRWHDQTPAAGVNVVALSVARNALLETRSRADGTYSLGPLPPGSVVVAASRKQGLSALLAVGSPQAATKGAQSRRSLMLSQGETKTGVDLELNGAAGRVSGVVVGPDGDPIAGARVGAASASGSVAAEVLLTSMTSAPSAVTDPDGNFMLEDLEQNVVRVWVSASGFPVASSSSVPVGSRGVRIQLQRSGSLGGKAVTAGGAPVAAFTVTALPLVGNGRPASPLDGTTRVIHDDSGAFEISGLGPGTYELLLTSADGLTGKLSPLPLTAGQRRDDLTVTVRSGAAVTGQVVSFPENRALEGAQVTVMQHGQPTFASTGGEGRFRLEGLVPGRMVKIYVVTPGRDFVPDAREVALSDQGTGREPVDLGTIKLVPGTPRLPETFADVGINSEVQQGKAIIRTVKPGLAGDSAGVRPGDIIASINGHDISGLSTSAVGYLLGGDPGTAVEIAVVSGGGSPRVVTLTRGATHSTN